MVAVVVVCRRLALYDGYCLPLVRILVDGFSGTKLGCDTYEENGLFAWSPWLYVVAS